MRQIVKVRRIAGCLVVGIPKLILKTFQVKEGDRVMLQTWAGSPALVVTKEKEKP